MPYENETECVADVDVESLLWWVSEGTLRPETTIHTGDMHTGLSTIDELASRIGTEK